MRIDRRKAIVAEGYDALGERYVAWASRILDPRERMLDAFSAALPRGARVLDLGCGAGVPSTKSLAARFSVTGVDISAAQIEAARRNVPEASFVHADLAQIDFPNRSFDGVTAIYVIPHIPREDHAELFGRIARWLVPGGLFLAVLGSADSPDWTGEWLGTPMFFSSYDAEANRQLLAKAGFELLIDQVLETVEPEGPVEFLWIVARRVQPAGAGYACAAARTDAALEGPELVLDQAATSPELSRHQVQTPGGSPRRGSSRAQIRPTPSACRRRS